MDQATLASLLGILIQGAGTVVLAVFAGVVHRRLGARPYFLAWCVAWAALAVGLVALALRFGLLPVSMGIDRRHDEHPLARFLFFFYQSGRLGAAACFALGAWLFAGRRAPSRAMLAALAVAILAFAALTAATVTPLNALVQVQAPVAAPLYAFAALLVLRARRGSRFLGARLVALLLGTHALTWSVYAVHFNAGPPADGTTLRMVLDVLTSGSAIGDFLQSTLLALSMVLLRTEDEAGEARRAQRELAEAQRLSAVGRLVSGVAHELNNPLAAVLTYSEELLARGPRPAADAEALATIREQALRARAIVRELLATARGRPVAASQAPVAIPALFEAVQRAARPAETASGARLVVTPPPEGGPPLLADLGAIEQVLLNLVGNGLAAAGHGGQVRLRATAEAEAWRLVVEDSGRGIPDDVLPRIFEPFFTTKPAGEGTGLGLAVSLGLVEQHGGTLVVENRPARGVGARFVVTLPAGRWPTVTPPPHSPTLVAAREAPVPEHVAPAADAAGPAVEGDVLLLVEDEAALRRAVARWFGQRGWRVETAADGRDAIARVDALVAAGTPPALLLCDLRMPHVTGMEFHAHLERTHPALARRLIVVTGDVASPDAAAFLARSGCPVLDKPFTLEGLAHQVRASLARADAADGVVR